MQLQDPVHMQCSCDEQSVKVEWKKQMASQSKGEFLPWKHRRVTAKKFGEEQHRRQRIFQPGRGHWKEGRRSPQRRNRNRSTDEQKIKRRKWRQVQQEARNPAGDLIRFELRPIPQRGIKGG